MKIKSEIKDLLHYTDYYFSEYEVIAGMIQFQIHNTPNIYKKKEKTCP